MSSSRVRDSSQVACPSVGTYRVKALVLRLKILSERAGWTSAEQDLMRAKPTRKALQIDGQVRLF